MNKIFDNDENGTKLLAIFVAQLVKEAVTFKIHDKDSFTIVELTGGY